MPNWLLGEPVFVGVLLILKAKRRSPIVMSFFSTSFRMIKATKNLRELGVSCMG